MNILTLIQTVGTHIDDGFDFLGKNFRKLRGKLITQPSKKNVNSIKARIRATIKRHRGKAAGVMIQALNPVIRGWAEAHKTVQASRAYRAKILARTDGAGSMTP